MQSERKKSEPGTSTASLINKKLNTGRVKKMQPVLKERKNQLIMRLSNTMQRMIRSIQRDFHEAYPYLKIVVDNKDAMDIPMDSLTDNDKMPPSVNINRDRTVAEVEKNCREIFGLPVHIFRKSSNVWVATSYTAHWTLEKQNREGEQISKLFPGTI